MSDESIFAAALALPNPAERAAYLDRACVGKPELRRQVADLLGAHAASNLLDQPAVAPAATGAFVSSNPDGPASQVGDRIGPYKLMEKIGLGQGRDAIHSNFFTHFPSIATSQNISKTTGNSVISRCSLFPM